MNQVRNIDLFYSAIKEVFELIELVKCPLCLKVCSEPTVFNCNHTVCLSCIENRFKETPLGKRSTCPVCQKVLNKRQKCRNEEAEYIVTYVNGISSNLQHICEFNIFSDKSFIKFIERYSPTKQTNETPIPSTSTHVTTRSKKPSVKTKLDSFKSSGTQESPEMDAFDKLLANTASVKSVKTYKNKKKEEIEKNKVEEVFDKVVEFEDSKSKEDIIKWLLDSKNEFDRLTQSTQGSIEEFYPEEDLVSISQSTKRARKAKNAKKYRGKRKCRSLGINANTKLKSSLKRHTLGVLNNRHEKIEISDSDSEDKNINNIVNLVEDDFIDSLNQFVEPKKVVNKKSKKASGWTRMQKLAKRGKRTTPTQKLNISLASQKKNGVSKSSFEDATLTEIKANETKFDASKDDAIVIEDGDTDSNKNENEETLFETNIAGNKKNAVKSKDNVVAIQENIVTMNESVVVEEVVEDSEEVDTSAGVVNPKKLIPYVKLTQIESFFEKYFQNAARSEYSVCNSDSHIDESPIPKVPDELQIEPQLQSESPQKEIVHNLDNITKEFELATEDNQAKLHQNSSTDSDIFTKVTQEISFEDFKFENVLSEFIAQYNSVRERFKKFHSLAEKSAQLTNLVKIVEPIFDKLKPEIDKISQVLSKEEICDIDVTVENGLQKESLCKCHDFVCKEFLEKAVQTEELVSPNEIFDTRNYVEKCVQTDNFVCMKCTQQITKPNSQNFFGDSPELEDMHFNTQDILANETNKTVIKLETRKETSNKSSREGSSISGTQTAKISSNSGRQNKKTNSSSETQNTKQSETQSEETITQIMENLEVITENSGKLVTTELQGESEDIVPSSENFVLRRSARLIIGNLSGKNSASSSKIKSDNSERTSTALEEQQKNSKTIENKTVAARFHKNNENDTVSATAHRLSLKTIKQDEAVASTSKRLSPKFKNTIKQSFEEFDENEVIPETEDFVFNSNESLKRLPTNAENEDEVFASTSHLKKVSPEQNKDVSKRNSQDLAKKLYNVDLSSINHEGDPILEAVASTSKRVSPKFKSLIKQSFDENAVIPETDDFVFNSNESLNRSPTNAVNEDEVFASTSHLKKLSPEQNKDVSKRNSQDLLKRYNVDLSSINHEGDPILEAIFNKNPQISSLDSDLLISIEPVMKRKLQYPGTNGEGNKFKRIRLLSSDSESNEGNAKKAKNKFIRDDVSIHFDTETQFGKSPEDEIMKVASLGSSDFNMDYVDQVWNKIDQGLLRTDTGISSPPRKKIKTQSIKETKAQEVFEKCDQIINDITNKMTYNKKTNIDRDKEKVRELLRNTIEDVGIENWQDSFIPDEVSYDQQKTVIGNQKCLNYMIKEFTNENSVEKEMEEMFKSNSPKQNKVSNKSQLVGDEGVLNNNKKVNILQDLTLKQKDLVGSLTIVPETNSMDAALQDFDVNKAIEEINTQASHFKKKQELDENVIANSDEELFKSDTELDVIESTPPAATNRISQSSNFLQNDVCAIPPPLEFQDCSNQTLVSETSQIIQTNRLLTSKISVSQPFLHSLSPIAKTKKNKLVNVGSPSTSFPIKHTSTPKTQKQSTLKKFMKQAQEKPEELFKLKFRSTKPCIACTRLSKEQIIAISSLCNKHLATYSTVFNKNTTHMIVSTNDNNCIKDHTIKFVSAVAAGIWVLSFNWVQECIAKKTIVPEEPYEVLDVSGIPGPRESRLNRKKRPLFEGFKIHAASPFASTTQSDVENIIKLLGGKVASTLDDLLDSKGYICLIITETRSSQDFELYEGWLETLKVVTVDIEWLSRSVGQYKLMSLRRFALCSDDTLGELGYPPELLEMVPYSFSQSPFN